MNQYEAVVLTNFKLKTQKRLELKNPNKTQ